MKKGVKRFVIVAAILGAAASLARWIKGRRRTDAFDADEIRPAA